MNRKPVTILMADDDPDDRMLTEEALREGLLFNIIKFVENGEELLEYLQRRGKFQDQETSPRPDLILLDLNMPRKDGREALKEIKADDRLKCIPIIVLTTSRAEEDIVRSYHLGVNSFIAKPVTFDGLVSAMRVIEHYWFDLVLLPPEYPTDI